MTELNTFLINEFNAYEDPELNNERKDEIYFNLAMEKVKKLNDLIRKNQYKKNYFSKILEI